MDTLLDTVVARALGTATASSAIRLRQRGELRLDQDKPWVPFKAEQVIQTATPAFRWIASVKLSRLLRVKVIDALEQGHGRLAARLWGVIPVARVSGPEIDAGESLRYMAELPWCPFAYLRNPSLAIRALDESHLSVSMPSAHPGQEITLAVDSTGDVLSARAERRPRLVGKKYEWAPWSGTYSDHGSLGGIRVPRAAVVRWHLPDGPFECFRGEVVALDLV